MYYSIAEVSKQLDLPYSTLRFWEKEFVGLKPFKNKRGVRYYTKENIELLKQIAYFTRQKHYTIEGARKAIRQEKQKEGGLAEVLNTLKEAKKILEDLQKNI